MSFFERNKRKIIGAGIGVILGVISGVFMIIDLSAKYVESYRLHKLMQI